VRADSVDATDESFSSLAFKRALSFSSLDTCLSLSSLPISLPLADLPPVVALVVLALLSPPLGPLLRRDTRHEVQFENRVM
jgi:hypothetical protein